ncbi:MAG: MBL fold metallo-hydrolase [Kiritimatiellia bacterium]
MGKETGRALMSVAAESSFTLRFLGTGTSVGVPMIGCACPVCTSTDPHDRRRRSSVYLSLNGQGVLIDAGPDLREQCLQWKVPRIDAIFITHLHADHIFGFDDVRRFNTLQSDQIISCFGGPDTIAGMHRIFNYITERPTVGLYRPLIRFVPVEAPFDELGAHWTPLPVLHGNDETNGLRIDFNGHSVAYIPDVHRIPEDTLAHLQKLDVLILNTLRLRGHPTHLTLDAALAYIRQLAPKRAFLTHLSHDLTHAQLSALLPSGVEAAYDGLELIVH